MLKYEQFKKNLLEWDSNANEEQIKEAYEGYKNNVMQWTQPNKVVATIQPIEHKQESLKDLFGC